MKDDKDLDRYDSNPIDQRRINRAVFWVEDAWWLIGPIAAAWRYKWWTVSLALAATALWNPEAVQALGGLLK